MPTYKYDKEFNKHLPLIKKCVDYNNSDCIVEKFKEKDNELKCKISIYSTKNKNLDFFMNIFENLIEDSKKSLASYVKELFNSVIRFDNVEVFQYLVSKYNKQDLFKEILDYIICSFNSWDSKSCFVFFAENYSEDLENYIYDHYKDANGNFSPLKNNFLYCYKVKKELVLRFIKAEGKENFVRENSKFFINLANSFFRMEIATDMFIVESFISKYTFLIDDFKDFFYSNNQKSYFGLIHQSPSDAYLLQLEILDKARRTKYMKEIIEDGVNSGRLDIIWSISALNVFCSEYKPYFSKESFELIVSRLFAKDLKCVKYSEFNNFFENLKNVFELTDEKAIRFAVNYYQSGASGKSKKYVDCIISELNVKLFKKLILN